ncbi:sn-glycerol-3-phosphate ABC transporter ATP-binding protein UgpC [Curvibacter sp. CHRR-16]|uniref:ABC transporter ATP-binding protein n=1 Tax=Curvibacter sp. CHRR-16 TaxID=2835872 RepID=UPI001BD9456B|nr:sn-glycerol-3-phosphate ABC transporter ATP-binding protein UgpC [Curvibacter sp. CHRR-16]MBT0569936.1 sn-glycerol-3-phosphate ABC transporter ATP-binding protein UgpC [Curvibacter sp. CHRR-16]
MAEIILEGIRKSYGDIAVVEDFNLHIQDGEFVVFVGPSGCGKSTTLRMIAGLEDISSGTLRIGGTVVNDLQPSERDIAMVFQSYALYPHMTVEKNLAFALKLQRVPQSEAKRRVAEAAKMLHLEDLLHRRPKDLSGGQRQRVALGRAIVREPRAFLMDEPLSNLDAKLRGEMRSSIAKLHQRLGVTTVYVTHDQVEAMTMGDRIVVMKGGRIQQIGNAIELYERPQTRFVAGFMGSPAMQFLPGQLANGGVIGAGFSIRLPASKAMATAAYNGKAVSLGVRPEAIGLKGHTSIIGEENQVRATVDVVEPLGAETLITASTADGSSFVARVGAHVRARIGDEADFIIDTQQVHVFDDTSEANISLL